MADPLPSSIFVVGGSVQASDGLYLTRQADTQLPALCRAGAFVYILTSRQMGKSSLINHTKQILAEEDIQCTIVDLNTLGTHNISPDEWYFGLLYLLADGLELSTDLPAWWEAHRSFSAVHRFNKFVLEEIVGTGRRIVIAIDEIDATLQLPFSDDFFAVIRALHGERANTALLENLSFVLVGVATPTDLISNPAKTPFNIGTRIDLADFTRQEIQPLAQGLALSDTHASEVLDWVWKWTKGHPFLTQRLCQTIAEHPPQLWTEAVVEEVVAKTFFGTASGKDSNLQFVRDMLLKRRSDPLSVLALYREVCRGVKVPDAELSAVEAHLKLSGVVRAENGYLQIRNPIYEKVFSQEWVEEQLQANLLAEPLRRWLEKAHHADYVLRGEALKEAQAWAEGRTFLAPEEQAFLTASAQAETEANLKQQQLKAVEERSKAGKRLSWALAALVLLLTTLMALAFATSEISFDLNKKKADLKTATDTLSEKNGKLATATREVNAKQNNLDKIKPQLTKAQGDLKITQVKLKDANASVSNLQKQQTNLSHSVQNLTLTKTELTRSNQRLKQQNLVAQSVVRGLQAISLAQQPNHDDEALVQGLMAVGPYLNKKSKQVLPPEAMLGLTSAVQAFKCLARMRGHSSQVYSASFSPDGKRIVTTSGDHTARLWDGYTGKPLGTPMVHPESIRSASFSPDGKRILTTGYDNAARLWDGFNGKPLGTPIVHSLYMLSFSPDGKRIVTTDYDGIARLWDGDTGKPLGTPLGSSSLASFSPDGTRIVTTSGDNITRLWDGFTGKPMGKPMVHSSSVLSISFSPDGKRILTAIDDHTVRLWDGYTGEAVGTPMVHPESIRSASFSPNGKRILTTSGNDTVRLWDGYTGEAVGTPMVHSSSVLFVSFSPDSKRIVTISGDNIARLWDGFTGKPLGTPLVHSGQVNSADFAPDGKRILTTSGANSAQLWDGFTGKPLGKPIVHSSFDLSASFSPDGKRILTASGNNSARLWDGYTGKPLGTPMVHSSSVLSLFFSRDGTRILTSTDDHTAWLWDGFTGKPLGTPMGHPEKIRSAAFSPDEKQIVTICDDNTVRLWDGHTGSLLTEYKGQFDEVNAVSQNGSLVVVASKDEKTIIYSTKVEDYFAMALRQLRYYPQEYQKVQHFLAQKR